VAEARTQSLILEFIRRARDNGFVINLDPREILVAWVEDSLSGTHRLAKIITKHGVIVEIDSRGYVAIGSTHECYCGG